jgi:DNA-binding transcriptional ArsR family regulator
MSRGSFMPGSKVDLIFHPIRLDIISAISTQRMTAGDLGKIMPGVPLTTLYRHINLLVEGGVLEIVAEHPIRGTVERVYALAGPPSLNAEDLVGMTKKDYEQAFAIYLSSLLGDARNYLAAKPDDQEIDLFADGVEVTKLQLLLSDEEFRRLDAQLIELILSAAKNEPTPSRRRRVLSLTIVPVESRSE